VLKNKGISKTPIDEGWPKVCFYRTIAVQWCVCFY
jgi:hypothetical protein